MFNFIASTSLYIPKGSGLNSLIYGLIRGVYNLVGNYGAAVILFTLLMRLIVSPLDFYNKYLTKRNTAKMAEFKEEDNDLKKQFASNPMAYYTARRDLYRRNNYKPGGAALFMLANMVVTLIIFFTVFSCLGNIGTLNLKRQYEQLGKVYIEYEQSTDLEVGSEDFYKTIDATYKEYNSSFLWVHNIFRPDTWDRKTPIYTKDSDKIKFFKDIELPLAEDAASEEKDAYRIAMYDAVFTNHLNKTKYGWNGYFILVILSAVTIYFSTAVNTNAMKKKKEAESKKEIEVGYSIRKTKESTAEPTLPQIDPAAMGKVMKFILPAVMVIFTFSATAAFALYISIGAVIQTSLGLCVNFLTDRIIARQEKNKKANEPKHPVINPHSRYFKKKL